MREFLLKNNLYNEPGIYHEDNYFTPQVLMKAKDVSCINEYVYAYRVRTCGSITSCTKPKHIKDMLFIARNLYGQITDSKESVTVFRQYIGDLYTNIITRSYDSKLPLSKWWKMKDSFFFKQCAAHNARARKSARLTIIHTRWAYMYLEDRLPHIVRRLVNKYL